MYRPRQHEAQMQRGREMRGDEANSLKLKNLITKIEEHQSPDEYDYIFVVCRKLHLR
jgi:hypothetical protein